MKKPLREWSFEAPWGKIYLVAWGNPDGIPVLLVHGSDDSVAAYNPLMELLPDKYYYVGVDLPGHGKSNHFPKGLTLGMSHFIAAIEETVNHLSLDQFIYIGHSLGTLLGLFYNAINPRRIIKLILLDPSPALQELLVLWPHPKLFQKFYVKYYDNYDDMNNDPKVYSKKRAIEAVMTARHLTEQQAELILSRNLKKIGEDQFRLSWDRRVRVLVPFNVPSDYYLEIFSRNSLPMLAISARHSKALNPAKREKAEQLIEDLSKRTNNFTIVHVDGGHDVHFTNPERFAEQLAAFMEKDIGKTISKL